LTRLSCVSESDSICMQALIHIDGGARGNPGPAGVGVVIHDENGKALHEAGYFLGKCTNNVAEYHGLIRGITTASSMNPTSVTIHSDSELVVKQITGEYRVKSPDLKPLFEQAQLELVKLGNWQIRHVRREQNKRADELANKAMDAKKDVIDIGEGASGKAASAGLLESANGNDWWTASLATNPGKDCPSKMKAKTPFRFGPDTPAGVCIYAAKAILNDGPMSDRPKSPRCERCGVEIAIDTGE